MKIITNAQYDAILYVAREAQKEIDSLKKEIHIKKLGKIFRDFVLTFVKIKKVVQNEQRFNKPFRA